MTIVEELEAMEGWAIEAQQSYSSDKELALRNLKNIYNQSRRMRGVPKIIFNNLASIQASVLNIQNEKKVNENFASLIKTIRESIDLGKQVKEGRTLEGRELKGRILESRILESRILYGRKKRL